jgi:hypothetical protein
MGEDYENDQARFTEVTDKELEAFQKVVTEIATGKEEPEPTIAERLEGVAVVIRELLGEPDFINHEELDVGDVQRALGELEEAISSLEEEEEPDALTAEGVAKILGDFANRSSARSDKELAEALGNQHRTLQQAITRIFVEWMRHLHGQAGQLGHYDDRNEASVMLAHAMFEDIAPEKLYLPLI